MLGKRTRPAIGRLAGAIRSSGIVDSVTSPRSPLECKMQSPRGLKNYDQGGIGLGIVVALDKKANCGGEILAKYAICGQFSARSCPIPVTPCVKDDNKFGYNGKLTTKDVLVEMEGLDEELTYVTCHGPNKSITTKVYYDGDEYCKIGQNVVVGGVFNISPVTTLVDNNNEGCASGSSSSSDSDFLSSCHLCRKTLHGKDIYMYRGEKAFCSTECRQKQIRIDERKEKCRSEASRSGGDVVSSSPCTYASRGQIFFSPGIVAV